jgi:hypothetical protein
MGHCSQNIEEHIIYMKAILLEFILFYNIQEQYSNQLLEAANEYFD